MVGREADRSLGAAPVAAYVAGGRPRTAPPMGRAQLGELGRLRPRRGLHVGPRGAPILHGELPVRLRRGARPMTSIPATPDPMQREQDAQMEVIDAIQAGDPVRSIKAFAAYRDAIL